MLGTCKVKNACSVFLTFFVVGNVIRTNKELCVFMCSFGYTFFNSGGFTMEKLTAGLFSKVLKDSINDDLSKIVSNYAVYLEPAKGALINSEATVALFDIKKILSKKNISENTKLQKIRDVFDRYDLDFDSYI